MKDTTTRNFDTTAASILKAQKKLGALKGLKATVLTLDDSRKQRLKTAGKYSVAVISAAALASAGLYLRGKKQETKTKPLPAPYKPGSGHHKAGLKYVPTSGVKQTNFAHAKRGVKKNITDADLRPWNVAKRDGRKKFVVKDEDLRPWNTHKKSGRKFVPKGADKIAAKRAEVEAQNAKVLKGAKNTKYAAAGVAAAGTAAAGALAGVAATGKKQTLLIEARYAYGTKLFEVARLTEEEVKAGVDKKILREVTAAVSKLKNVKDWAVKESASIEYLKMAEVAEALVEESINGQLLEDADVEVAATNAAKNVSDFEDVTDSDEEVEEGFLFEDEDEEEEVEEGFLFEDEDEEEDDEDLAEAYIFEDEDEEEPEEDEEDLAEAYIFEDEDEEEDEEDEEDLAEAYIFED